MKKLHIGFGFSPINGWINGDCWVSPEFTEEYKEQNNIILMDATVDFPFENNDLDFIYSEHMIEHLPYLGFVHYISEAYRCLKPGGVIRTAWPKFEFYFELYNNPEKYKDYIVGHFNMFNQMLIDDWGGAENVPAIFAINDNFRMWDHQCMYDTETVKKMFERVGFSNIVECKYDESEHEELRNLEHDNKRGREFNILETGIIECTK